VKLEDFDAVKQLKMRVDELERDKFYCEKGLGVTIQGRYQSDEIIDATRPIVLAKLDEKIADCYAALRNLGVSTP
jgi:hypothetical protein